MADSNEIYVVFAACKCNVWPIVPTMRTGPCVDCKQKHQTYYDAEQMPITNEAEAFDRFERENNKKARRDNRRPTL